MFKWDGIAVFPNASKLAKLAFELTCCAAAIHKGKKECRGKNKCRTMQCDDDKPKDKCCEKVLICISVCGGHKKIT